LKQLKKYVGRHQSVVGYSFHQFISFEILGSLDIFYRASFELILHSSNKGEVPLEGGLPGSTLFFYLSSNHFRIDAEGASLDLDGR
jgi:hypothetical protein